MVEFLRKLMKLFIESDLTFLKKMKIGSSRFMNNFFSLTFYLSAFLMYSIIDYFSESSF